MIAGEIVVLGANHRTAPLCVRERLARAGFGAPAVGRALAEGLITEGAFLSTCNRLEAYAVLPAGPDPEGRALGAFVAILGTDPLDFADAISLRTGRPAVTHLFRVACGLDSLVLGETQILGQVRDAFAAAVAAGHTGPVLNRLFHQALRVGKRARAESTISAGISSIPSAAARVLTDEMEGLRGRAGVLLGAGSMASLVASHLRGQGLAGLVVANRTRARAQELAATCGGRAACLEELADEVLAADFLVAACAAPGPLLHGADLASRWARRGGRRLVAVDLSVPRVIARDVASLEAVSLLDLDALDGLLRGELDRRRDAAGQVEALVRDELEAFWCWHAGRGSVAPLITALAARCEAIRRQTIERNVRFLGAADPAQVERFSQSLVAKLIDRPLRQIRAWDPTAPEGLLRLEIVKELFGVEGEGEGSIAELFDEVGIGAPGRPAVGETAWTT